MYYRISEITRQRPHGHTYVLVDFWRTRAQFDAIRPPTLTNDFVMAGLRPDEARAEIDRIIRNYWRTAAAEGWTGDHTADTTKQFVRKGIIAPQRVTPMVQRDTTDNGIIEQQEIKDLVGVGKE